MPLRQVAENDHECCGKDHGGRRIPAQHINKKFQQNIVDQDTGDCYQKITEELGAAAKVRTGKHHEHAEVKTGRESDTKGNQEGSDMCADGNGSQVEYHFIQHKIVQDKIKQDVERGIATPTCGIPKGLQGHKGPAQRVKKIHCIENGTFCKMVQPTHGLRR